MPDLKTMIVYGNCQAQAITAVLSNDPVASSLFRVVYVRSFEHPSEANKQPADEELANCALLCEQHDRLPFPYRNRLPSNCVTVKFPSVDFNLLWPFNSVNPYNKAAPPEYPLGPFPYGDRVILNCVEMGMKREDILDYYLTRWDEYQIDLERLAKIEASRLAARDARCDVQMSSWVLERFRTQRLYWTINHPTSTLLRELLERLFHACAKAQPAIEDVDVDTTLKANFPPRGPLGVVAIPVHPKVAEQLGLDWYNGEERYPSFNFATYTYEGYFRALIDYCCAAKATTADDSGSSRRSVVSA
jgi:Polysaccharide biosynthesis enzyme WcbI